MKNTSELDVATKREVRVQTTQACFHFLMVVMMYVGCPLTYITSPTLAVEEQHITRSGEPFGVKLVYLLAASYNTVLYFWDPLSSSKIRHYHILAVFISPILLIYNEIGILLCVTVAVYCIDLSDTLVKYRYADQLDKRRVLLGMIKIHHMVTLMLIGLSWIYDYAPYGIFIMFIHDLTDVSMFVVRILRKTTVSRVLEDSTTLDSKIVFAGIVVMLTWFYYRVVVMAIMVYEIYVHVMERELSERYYSGMTCVVCLGVLWLLNVYWTTLVIVKAVREIRGIKTETDDE